MDVRDKKSPHILIINWQDWLNPLSGGAEVNLREIFTRLTDEFDITLLCSRFKGAPGFEEIQGIKIYRVGSRNLFNFFVPSSYRKLNRFRRFDLVIEDLNKIPFFGRFFVKEKRIAVLHHLFGRTIYTETNPMAASYVYFSEKLIPIFYRDIPIVAVSESTKENLIKMAVPEENIQVVYNGVDLSFYRSFGELYERPTVICLGRMKRYKRMDILIESLPEVAREIPNLLILFVGSGDDLPRLMRLAKKKGLEGVIEFKGYVSDQEKKETLSRSWVSVNTSPKEGWGLTSMESQSLGTPSIVPDSPGLRETVKDNETGYLYPFGSVSRLSGILIDLLKDKGKVIQLGENARRWASNFSWDRSASMMKIFIKEVIKRS